MLPIKFYKYLAIFTLSVLCCSCGGGSESPAPGQASSPQASPQPQIDPNIERYFVEEFRERSWGSEVAVNFSGFSIAGLKYYNSDKTNGFTNESSRGDLISKEGLSTHFHLGSIEFHAVGPSTQLSIFHLLRTHNHVSNEVINLTRLLMLLDANNAQSNIIMLNANIHTLVTASELLLDDLYSDATVFENSTKVQTLLAQTNSQQLPSVQAAQAYLYENFNKWIGSSKYAQWPVGFEIDFDNDGVLNELDAFPWDATQSSDINQDGIGDSPIVRDFFLETHGVVEYEVDTVNGFLYVPDFNKNLYRYDLETGQRLALITFEDFITDIEIDQNNGNVYIGFSDQYNTRLYTNNLVQTGSIALLKPHAERIEKRIDIGRYPTSIKLHSNGKLYISARNYEPLAATLLISTPELDANVVSVSYRGRGGAIYVGNNKLVTVGEGSYSVIDISNGNEFLAEGNLSNSHNEPMIILDQYDALIDDEGTGFRLSLQDGESWISGDTVQYIDLNYYDIRGLAAGRLIHSIFKDDSINQYIVLSASHTIYINASTLIPHKIFKHNDYVSTINGALNYHKYKVANYNDKTYSIVSKRDGTTYIAATPNQCGQCGLSQAPIANIDPVANNLSIQDPVLLNGSLSVDNEDANELMYRWDFNNDGKWDTEFLEQSAYSVKYELAGEKIARLQVMDSSGLVGESQLSFNLLYGVNYGKSTSSTQLKNYDLRIHDTAYDASSNRIFLSSSDTGQFFVLDASTGHVIRQFDFRYLPTQMSISDANGALYLGLQGTGCQLSIVACENDIIGINDGIILKYDLASEAFVDSFAVDLSPADIEIFDGHLYVSTYTYYNSASDFNSSVAVYSIDTHEKVRNLGMGIGNYGEFTNMLFIKNDSSNTHCNNSVNRMDYYCDGNIRVLHEDITYKPMHWWIPDASVVLSNIGKLYDDASLTEIGAFEPLNGTGVGIKDIAISQQAKLLIVAYHGLHLSEGGLLQYYNLDNLELLKEDIRETASDWVFISANHVIEISKLGNYQYDLNLINLP